MSKTRPNRPSVPLSLKLWISGFLSETYEVGELWRITWHPLVIAVSLFLGCSYTYFMWLTIVEDTATLVYVVVFGGLVVITNNTGVCLVFWALSYLKALLKGRSSVPVVATSLVVLAVCPATLSLSAFLGGSLSNPAITAYAWETIPLVTIGYVIVSDIVYFFLFRYLLPSDPEKLNLRRPLPVEAVAKDAPPKAPGPTAKSVQRPSKVRIGSRSLEPSSIILLEAQGNYLRVVTQDDESTERHRISQAVKALGAELGFSPHRSFWIAFDRIEATSQVEGRLIIEMQGGERVPVAGTKTREVRSLLKET